MKTRLFDSQTIGSNRVALYAASCVFNDNRIFCTGGIFQNTTNNDTRVYDAFAIYDVGSNAWIERLVPGYNLGRVFSSAVNLAGRMFLYGGLLNRTDCGTLAACTDPQDTSVGAIDVVSVTSQTLRAADPSSVPTPRASHCMVPWTDQSFLVLFGFTSPPGGIITRLNDVWMADVSSPTVNWTRPSITGDVQPPLTANHACARFGSRIYVFGGQTTPTQIGVGGGSNTNAIWALETKGQSWQWIQIAQNSTGGVNVPNPRQAPQMVIVGTYMIVSGGSNALDDFQPTDRRAQFYFFDLCSNQWVAPVTSLDPSKNKCDNGLGGDGQPGGGSGGGGASEGSRLSTGVIIGIVVGIIVLLGAIALVILWFWQKKRDESKSSAPPTPVLTPATAPAANMTAVGAAAPNPYLTVAPHVAQSPPPTYSGTVNTRTVIEPYKPAQNDEIELRVGDTIAISTIYSDGWAHGMNITTTQIGAFPIVCLEGMASEYHQGKQHPEFANPLDALSAGAYASRSDSLQELDERVRRGELSFDEYVKIRDSMIILPGSTGMPAPSSPAIYTSMPLPAASAPISAPISPTIPVDSKPLPSEPVPRN
ncbi:Leucine-zipper-like transcriptional regulator 1 [Quaeritorhiza haematococci]|nr:Leucine-zipper-like transcriptional regulator 1 [Quaeritorhiza haematococci]